MKYGESSFDVLYLVFAITLAVNGITEFLYQKYLVFRETD